MAVGDAFTPPVLDHSFEMRSAPPVTQNQMNKEYFMEFNKNEWELVAVSWRVEARQSFLPVVPGSLVKMDIVSEIISYNPNGTANLGSGSIEWGPFSSGEMHFSEADRPLTVAIPPDRVSFKISHSYRLPYPPATEQVAQVRDLVSVVLVALVDNPTSTPRWGEIKDSTNNPQSPIDYGLALTVILGLAGAAAVLWGGGYLVEKLKIK